MHWIQALPAPASLGRVGTISISISICCSEEPFYLLAEKIKSLKDVRDHRVSILFDEIHLEARPRYSNRWKEMVPGAKSAVCVVVKGLGNTTFREIVYYSPDNVDKATLHSIIVKVENCGARVEAVVFDMGNSRLQRELNMYDGQFYFPNPARPNEPVFLIPDACHRYIM